MMLLPRHLTLVFGLATASLALPALIAPSAAYAQAKKKKGAKPAPPKAAKAPAKGKKADASEEASGGTKPINLKQLTDPNDIDFDSVPPPNGIPKKYASEAPAKKKGGFEEERVEVSKPVAKAEKAEKIEKAEKPEPASKSKGKASKAEPEEKAEKSSAASKLTAAMGKGKGKKGKASPAPAVETAPEPAAKAKRVVFTAQ